MQHIQSGSSEDQTPNFSRFKIYQGRTNFNGEIERAKTVGMAYLAEGQSVYTIKLWTFSREKFYLIPTKKSASKYYIMTRELNQNPEARAKYFWNIVGNGTVDSIRGIMELDFDILSRLIYMNIFPESQASSIRMPEPELMYLAA